MSYYVYLIVSKVKKRTISYVGYTNNLNNRIKLHNSGQGQNLQRKEMEINLFKKYQTKKTAMIEEYKLKKNYKLRKN